VLCISNAPPHNFFPLLFRAATTGSLSFLRAASRLLRAEYLVSTERGPGLESWHYYCYYLLLLREELSMSDTKVILTPDQAESLLPPGERVHGFVNPPWGFVECDSSRKAVVRLIREARLLEIGGERAKRRRTRSSRAGLAS
jgi:hypothetical protein